MTKFNRGTPAFYAPTISTKRKSMLKPSTSAQKNEQKPEEDTAENSRADEIYVQEISKCNCNPQMKDLKKRIKFHQKELTTMSTHMRKTEVSKLELANRCNTLEAHVAGCARDAITVKKLRMKCKHMSEEKAEVEADFMNQLSDLSTQMQKKEREIDARMKEKDDTIAFLKSKLAAYKIMSSTGEVVVDRNNSPARFPISRSESRDDQISESSSIGDDDGCMMDANDYDDDCVREQSGNFRSYHAETEGTEYLTNALTECRFQNDSLSKEVQELYDVVDHLQIKAAKLPEIENQLKESNEILATYKRANSLLSQLDDHQEGELRKELQDSTREEEEFMNQLESLELDMSADLKELEFELLASAEESHEI